MDIKKVENCIKKLDLIETYKTVNSEQNTQSFQVHMEHSTRLSLH